MESIKPNGFEEWAEKATKLIQDNPGIFNAQAAGPIDAAVYDGWTFITTQQKPKKVRRAEEWDGEIESSGTLEGPRNSAERANQRYLAPKEFITNRNAVPWVPAPILDASQYV